MKGRRKGIKGVLRKSGFPDFQINRNSNPTKTYPIKKTSPIKKGEKMKKSIAVILSSAVICLLLQSPAFGSYNLQTPQEETSALQSGLSDLTFGPQIKPVLFVKDAEGYCIAPLEGRINYESISRFLSRQEEAFPIDPISKPKLCPPQTMETALDLMTQGKALNQFAAGPAVMIPLTGLYLYRFDLRFQVLPLLAGYFQVVAHRLKPP